MFVIGVNRFVKLCSCCFHGFVELQFCFLITFIVMDLRAFNAKCLNVGVPLFLLIC